MEHRIFSETFRAAFFYYLVTIDASRAFWATKEKSGKSCQSNGASIVVHKRVN
jgi:hypothetical protein